MISVHVTGVLSALGILIAIGATLYWMLHPAASTAERAAQLTERDVVEMIGSVLVIFSAEIHSEHVMSLAARVARRERARLLAAYVIEVPHTLPVTAEMELEHREALGVLQVAESIARQNNVEISTEIVRARQVAAGSLELAKRAGVHLIVLGSYREGKYAGAPLGRAIEVIAAQANCDVLIGIQGNKRTILTPPHVDRRTAVT
ncbi:MAG: universal stress protein [Candidatus Eremiobacteraeota bacterium]|nr:universal stress protein [Candidatus Eremiobacteraeota bacterium]